MQARSRECRPSLLPHDRVHFPEVSKSAFTSLQSHTLGSFSNDVSQFFEILDLLPLLSVANPHNFPSFGQRLGKPPPPSLLTYFENGPYLRILPLRLPLRDAESARRQNILSWAMGMDSRTRDSGGRKESDAARFGEYTINCA